uniref:site-specific DNA-methyltransferase (adenine-specific) n=1 Tax=Geobacillus stearothermophilus TaxID=1422 RepID=Q6SPF6_GEOSE|nr:M1.BsaI [Geobacillus stearothermophilus]
MSNAKSFSLNEKTEANALIDFIIEKSNQSKDLGYWLQKSKGQFYTHNFIGEKLVTEIVENIKFNDDSEVIKIIDPFCGDGRLICILLDKFNAINKFRNTLLEIEFWDIDPEAVEVAYTNIKEKANALEFNVQLKGRVCDTFLFAQDYFGSYDICITNPPWVIIKPDKKEKERLSKEEEIEYIEILKNFDDFLSRYYPTSLPTKKYGGWGTNLARCGTEVALRLISKVGICGIVSPASLLGDQVSDNLRVWMFNNYEVYSISYFVAEAKLFGKVDQAVITLTLSPKCDDSSGDIIPHLFYYDRELFEKRYYMDEYDWRIIKSLNYVIPIQFGLEIIKMNRLFKSLPTLGDLENEKEGIWLGRELDETGIKEKLANKGQYRFIKGKMVGRYNLIEESNQYIDVRKIDKIPKSVEFYRLVWRDVSRTTQKRRLISTIIPPKYITGNSLNVAYFKDNNLKKLKALLAIMNSFVFEAQVRANLSTNHISLGIIRRAHIPKLEGRVVDELSQLVDNYVNEESELLLEVKVAKAYGLSFEDFSSILSLFDKIGKDEKEKILQVAKKYLKGGIKNDS